MATPALQSSPPAGPDGDQQHPLKLYLLAWGLLFVLSAGSYWVDYAALQGPLRWTLILTFMLLKAGLIVAVFMHVAYERLALACAVLLPPVSVLVFLAIMAAESGYTLSIRAALFSDPGAAEEESRGHPD